MLGYLIKEYALKPSEQVLEGFSNYFNFTDNNPNKSREGSRKSEYWESKGYLDKWNFQNELPEQLRFASNGDNLVKSITDYFNLQGIEFGNWVSQEDRFNYLQACIVSLLTIEKLTSFPAKTIGLRNFIGIGIGSRGRGKALAHFEPSTGMINITRHHREEKPKAKDFYTTGGVGSLGHEYGHGLDYFFGLHTNEKINNLGALTDEMKPSSYSKAFPLRKQMNKIIDLILYDKKKEDTPYVKAMAKVHEGRFLSYLMTRTELFARAFEVYLLRKSTAKFIRAKFLIKPTEKYTRGVVYIRGKHAKVVCDEIDKLLILMKKKF